jgi:hypothetical protein
MAGVKALHAGMRGGIGMSMVDSLPELKILEKLNLSLPELNLEIPELDLMIPDLTLIELPELVL